MVGDGRKPRKDECRGRRRKIETQQIWSDGKTRWKENRWKQKRETQDTECKVREVQSRQHHGASPAERNEFPQRTAGSVMEMGAWQLLWLTVNRILVRHTASGEAHGAWHHRSAVSSWNTPTVPPSICLVPLLQPAQTPLVSNLWSRVGVVAEAVRAHPDTKYMTCSTCLPTKLQRGLLSLQRKRNTKK